MKSRKEQAQRLSECLEYMMMKFKSVDMDCMQIKSDLSSRDFHLISFVGHHDNVIMKDIADELGVPMSTATGIVDKLVQKGYLKRKYSESDRRIVLIDLDNDGKDAFDLFARLKQEASESILSILSTEDSEIFIRYLERIATGFLADVQR